MLQGTSDDVPEPLSTPDTATPVATPGAGDAMPPVQVVLVGLPLPGEAGVATPVSSDSVPLTIMLSMDDLDAALQGRDWIEMRYPGLVSPITKAPYTDRFGQITVRVIGPEPDDDPAAIVIGASLERGRDDWLAIVTDRDLGFAGWLPEE